MFEGSELNIIYLACPYTHTDFSVMEARYKLANDFAAQLIGAGSIVFSPITMTHPIDKILARNESTLGSEYWVKFDEAFMHVCSKMIVLMVDGWSESQGIRREIEFFKNLNKEVEFWDPKNKLTKDVPKQIHNNPGQR
jgi:hypothetical protein